MTSGQEQSERTTSEYIPPLDKLRGPNSTLRLTALLEETLRYSGAKRAWEYASNPTIMQQAVLELNKWAGPIDSKVRTAAGFKPPHSGIELEQIVKGLIRSRAIYSSLSLWEIVRYNGPNHLLARQDQWNLVQALFGIDTSLLGPNYAGGQVLSRVHDLRSEYRDQGRLHKLMFDLIEKAVQSRGGSFEIVTDEIGTIYPTGPTFKAPSLIDGITAKVSVNNKLTTPISEDGYPNIEEIIFDFSPSFLASVRPLQGEGDPGYSQRQKRQEQQGYREQRKEEPKSESGSKERSEGYRREPEGQDPNDPQGYYKMLGINPGTNPEDMAEVILATYRRLARKYHPDTGGTKTDEDKMKAINAAYEFLKKAENRRKYGRGF